MSYSECTNLVETRDRLINEIIFLSDDAFNLKPSDDIWSLAQVSHHLVLTETAFTRAIEYGLKKSPDHNPERRNVQLVLDRSKKIDAPDMVKPAIEHLEVPHVIHLLNDSRNYLLSVLESIEDPSILAKKSVTHPVFGDLPLDQWIDALYMHEQRHIEQIKEIKLLIGISK